MNEPDGGAIKRQPEHTKRDNAKAMPGTKINGIVGAARIMSPPQPNPAKGYLTFQLTSRAKGKQYWQPMRVVVNRSLYYRRRFFFTNGQRKLECCALAIILGGPQPPTVGLDNRAADRQSHAHSFRFCRKESGEEMIETVRIEPRARISHGDQQILLVIFFGADHQLSRPIARPAHGFDGIDNQIEYHLLQLYSISQDGRHITRELSL